MAQKVAVTFLDDLDGTKAAETVSFGLDGATYEIDLSAKNARALRKAIGEFQAAARPVRPMSLRPARPRRRSSKAVTPAQIRDWAISSGVEVSARGRISAAVREQYFAANGV